MLSVLTTATLVMGLSSCGNDNGSSDSELNVSPGSLSFGANADSRPISITSNVKWTIATSQSWITVSKTSGSGDETIYVYVDDNQDSGNDRTGRVTITASKGGITRIVDVNQKAGDKQEAENISVTPTKVSLLGAANSTTSISVNATGSWSLTGLPDWLHASATSGVGNTTITLTALSENWSDMARSTVLTLRTSSSSTTATVSQEGDLPKNLRVTLSNTTIMSDGFACDLKFNSEAKGYKEAFFTASEIRTMNERDIYNKLMEKSEYSSLANYACLPGFVDPETELVYCVAAFGNESNADGSHKYGPMTIEHITTKAKTVYDDMYLSSSYNSSLWTVVTARRGSYGQKCDEYYYIASEDYADEYHQLYQFTDAMLAHLLFKPMIAENDRSQYKYGPQTMTFSRTGDKFFCTTWGIDRDTKEYSAELSIPVYRDLSSTTSSTLQRVKKSPSEWNKPYRHLSTAEINKLRQSLKVYKVLK